MVYPAYLLCIVLILPALAAAAFVGAISLLAAGPKNGWSVIIGILAFFGAGLSEPLRYGWRIIAFIAATGFFLGAGAIPSIRIPAFYGLATLATLCIAYTLFAASQQDRYNVINALIITSPSIVGIVACLWFAIKFKT